MPRPAGFPNNPAAHEPMKMASGLADRQYELVGSGDAMADPTPHQRDNAHLGLDGHARYTFDTMDNLDLSYSSL